MAWVEFTSNKILGTIYLMEAGHIAFEPSKG